MKVLFVCDGNICRSPLAEAYFRHRAASAGLGHLLVGSAGILGIEGAPAAPLSIEVAKGAGLDLTRHRSRGVTSDDAVTADWLITMTSAQLETLARRFPAGRQRRLMLRAFEDGPAPRAGAKELIDPVTGPVKGYRDAFAVIKTCVDNMIVHLGYLP